jgi:anti-sigma B factor antagonist
VRFAPEDVVALGIVTIKTEDVVVLRLSGVIYFGEESAALRQRVKDQLDNSRQIVLDLAGVTHIDSGGLGTLVGLFASVKKAGGHIKLANLGDHPQEVLQITKLFTVFEIFERTEDAVASFKKAASAT